MSTMALNLTVGAKKQSCGMPTIGAKCQQQNDGFMSHTHARVRAHVCTYTHMVEKADHIFCRQIDGTSLAVGISSQDSIGDVKAKIEAKTGVPSRHFYLVNSGRVLDDDQNMLSYRIDQDTHVEMRVRVLGSGPKVKTIMCEQ